MCGICGVWGDGNDRLAVERMVSAMHHRGPDAAGVHEETCATLGMTRLAILDLSEAGSQPMRNRDGSVWIVYNGELYNFKTEREILEAKGHTFVSTSDTEVVLRMYEHYGDDFVKRLRGMFALAIHDRRGGREKLFLARDQMGIKSLLYARSRGRLVFASEVKALVASGMVEREVDPVALRQLLTYGSVYQPRTMLRGVSMLPPAHRMIVENGKEIVERYWSLGLDRRPELRGLSYEEQVEAVAAELEESVRLQMVSDVPLGAFLSGGVDSSLMVAMMSRAADRKVKTFSVGFEAEGAEIDETDDAERTARYIGTDHTRVVVRGEEVRDRIEHIASGLDQPSVDGVNSYFVSLAARRAVTVAISGTGGDELFAGYPWFIGMVLDEARRRGAPRRAVVGSLLSSLARWPELDPLVFGRGGGRLWDLRERNGFVSKYASQYQIFGTLGAARMMSPALKEAAGAGRSPHHDMKPLDELPNGSPIERVTALCLRGYTTNQLLRDIDAVSMSHSLEVRVPFLDPEVADVALSLPDSAKMSDLTGLPSPQQRTYRETGAKRILIDVGKKLLPDGFADQPKRGFGMPFGSWLGGPLRDVLQDTLSDEVVRRRGLLDVEAVSGIRDAFLAGNLSWAQPWLLMMLELWCREVLDSPSPVRLEAARS